MFPRRENGSPEQWRTQDILKWMQQHDDSKEEIKRRVISVVQTNDLDGHTLKQLAAEKDEIQHLFPALKERLAFKSMLRKLFKDESQALPPDPQSLPTPTSSPPTTPPQGPRQQRRALSSLHGHALALPKFHNFNPAATQFFETANASSPAPSTRSVYPTEEVANTRPVEKRPRLSEYTPPRELPVNTVTSVMPLVINQPSRKAIDTNLQVYFNYQAIDNPQKRIGITQAATPTGVSAVASSITSAVNQPCSQPTFAGTTSADSALRISSVTTLAKTENGEPQPRLVVPIDGSDTCQDVPTPLSALSAEPQQIIYRNHIDYPAPVPEFSAELQEFMRACPGNVSTPVRKRIVREASHFYVRLTRGYRLNCMDYVNIGRTIVEKYPALACDEGNLPWAFFNKCLSQSIRNLRRRIRQNNAWDIDEGLPFLAPLVCPCDDAIEVSGDDAIEVSDDDGGEVGGDDDGQDVFVIKAELRPA